MAQKGFHQRCGKRVRVMLLPRVMKETLQAYADYGTQGMKADVGFHHDGARL